MFHPKTWDPNILEALMLRLRFGRKSHARRVKESLSRTLLANLISVYKYSSMVRNFSRPRGMPIREHAADRVCFDNSAWPGSAEFDEVIK